MRHAHQVNEGIAARDGLAVRGGVQRVAGDAFAARGETLLRAAPHQPAHAVPARHQFRREPPAHEAARAGDEDTCHSEEYTQVARHTQALATLRLLIAGVVTRMDVVLSGSWDAPARR